RLALAQIAANVRRIGRTVRSACSARCTGRLASTRRRRSSTAPAGRCTSLMSASRSASWCNEICFRRLRLSARALSRKRPLYPATHPFPPAFPPDTGVNLMMRTYMGLLVLAAVAFGSPLNAADAPKKNVAPTDTVVLPRPADVQTLAIHPAKVALKGSDDALQLILTGTLAGGKQQDLTADVQYEVADAKIARVTSAGQVVPLANGSTTVTASYGDKKATVPVTAEKVGENLPINFANQVVPIFTKLGCNGGGCHGKASGQNGFRLSLLGFEPELDYMTIVKEGRRRRLFPAAPEQSLLLQKASGAMAHGGGKRLEHGSD